MCGTVGSTCIVLNREAPLPVCGCEKHLDMGDRFIVHRPLVSFPKICRENARVEDELVGVGYNLLVGIGSRAGVGICDRVINLPPCDLDRDGRCIYLTQTLVVRKQDGVRDHRVGLV